MKATLTVIVGVLLAAQAFIGFSFLMSCLKEREKRASLFAGLQLVCMLLLLSIFLYLAGTGFFQTMPGIALLTLALLTAATALFLLARRSAPNPKALKGTPGRMSEKSFSPGIVPFGPALWNTRPSTRSIRTLKRVMPREETGEALSGSWARSTGRPVDPTQRLPWLVLPSLCISQPRSKSNPLLILL
jgi:hypothetical protein